MTYRIGELARATGETVKTLRYWTNQGLLNAERGENGYRHYSPEAVTRAAFIRATQALGFTLEETRGILVLRDEGVQPCEHVRDRLKMHLAAVQSRIKELQILEDELTARLAWAERHPEPECSQGCIYLVVAPPS
jgi:DNA-binding transcriptional MerR regulator